MNILLRLSYVGTRYCGFQVQPNGETVQAVLGAAAEKILARPCRITGCSRTDSGVHAKEYMATVGANGECRIPCEQLPRALNTYLPPDICVHEAVSVPEDFSVRRAVAGKEYVYILDNGATPDPFLWNRACFYPGELHLETMRQAAELLVGTHDFRSFMASGREMADTVRTVSRLSVERKGTQVHITVCADGFLYNMVRIIVGTLLEVSEGKTDPLAMPHILASQNRECAGRTAPAAGLYLNRVFLSFPLFERKGEDYAVF